MPKKLSVRQLLVLVSIALIMMTLSLVTSLHLLGVSLGDLVSTAGSADEDRYYHATMTDAQFRCQEKLRNSFKNRISVMRVDTFSSRLSADGKRYKIFLEADIYPDSRRQGPTRELFISCFVHTSDGELERFQYAGDSEAVRDIGDDDTNAFGL